MNIIHSLLTRSNITLALSIFGSVGTLISFIFSVFKIEKILALKLQDVDFQINLVPCWFTYYLKTNLAFPFL